MINQEIKCKYLQQTKFKKKQHMQENLFLIVNQTLEKKDQQPT